MNIDEMEAGRELDALMAEVMGWEKKGSCNEQYWCFRRTKETHPDCDDGWLKKYPLETTHWAVNGKWSVDEDTPPLIRGFGHRGVWNPSTGISAAWVVVEHCCNVLEHVRMVDIHNAPNWYCKFFDEHGEVVSRSGFCETAPLAICRAAYKAVTSEHR